jgi:hypothetical protein
MGTGQNQTLEGGRELSYLSQQGTWGPYLERILSRIISSINTTATNASVSAVAKLPPPPKIDSIQVSGTQSGNVITSPSEILHFTLTHNQSINKGVQYLSEVDVSPNFTQPHVIDHGCSRSGFITLPTLNAAGVKQTYYLRSYAQYHGSDPSEPTVLGGLANPVQIQMTGTSKLNILGSTGSGTASGTGQQGGKGLGTVLSRPAPAPKRNTA